MLDFNVVYGLVIATLIVLFITYVSPYLRKNQKSNIYSDVKLGLLLFGYSFRDEKIKAITDLVLRIVQQTEQLDKAPTDKKDQAIDIAFRSIIKELDLQIEEEAIETIVNIAVSYLPPTNN